MMGTRYVGAGVLASAVGMDKQFMKLVLVGRRACPSVRSSRSRRRSGRRDKVACLEAVAALTLPGLRQAGPRRFEPGDQRVDDAERSGAAIELAQQHDPKIIVEQGFVGARELECGVLGRSRRRTAAASEVAEIRVQTASGFYDFDAKYLPEEQVELDVPADVDADIADAGASTGGARPSRPSAARGWPGWTSS